MTFRRFELMAFFSLFVLIAPAFAQEELFYWFDRERLSDNDISYGVNYYPRQNIAGQNSTFRMIEHEAHLAMPVWSGNDNQRLGVSADFRYQDIETRALLPGSGRSFPRDLYDPRFGVNYVESFENGWVLGGALSVGSPSDKPFHSWDEMQIDLNSFLRIPHVDNNHWLFALNFSTNREFLNYVPLPGVAYWYQPNDRLTAILGVPLALQYQPMDRVTLRASYLPIRNVFAESAYELTETLELFAGFRWSNDRFLLADRERSKDRLFYYEKQALGGLRMALHQNFDVELAGGFAFDRFYFEGRKYRDRKNNRMDIGDSPFAAAKLNLRF